MNIKQQSIDRRVNEAFNKGLIFYKPWCNQAEYSCGVKFPGNDNIIKVLVIGASRYCEIGNEIERCPVREQCLMEYDSNALKAIKDVCPFVKDSSRRKYYHNNYCLQDTNDASFLMYYYNKGINPDAYRRFAEKMINLTGLKAVRGKKSPREINLTPTDFWFHFAFFNYLHTIVWNSSNKGNEKETPDYTSNRALYEKSRDCAETLIPIIDPDLIILWCPAVFKTQIYSLFTDIKARTETLNAERGKRAKTYKSYDININGTSYPAITCPHPSDKSAKVTDLPSETILEGKSIPGDTATAWMTLDKLLRWNHDPEEYNMQFRQEEDWEEFAACLNDYIASEHFREIYSARHQER